MPLLGLDDDCCGLRTVKLAKEETRVAREAAKEEARVAREAAKEEALSEEKDE